MENGRLKRLLAERMLENDLLTFELDSFRVACHHLDIAARRLYAASRPPGHVAADYPLM